MISWTALRFKRRGLAPVGKVLTILSFSSSFKKFSGQCVTLEKVAAAAVHETHGFQFNSWLQEQAGSKYESEQQMGTLLIDLFWCWAIRWQTLHTSLLALICHVKELQIWEWEQRKWRHQSFECRQSFFLDCANQICCRMLWGNSDLANSLQTKRYNLSFLQCQVAMMLCQCHHF